MKKLITCIMCVFVIGCNKNNEEKPIGIGSSADRFTSTFITSVAGFSGLIDDFDKDGLFTIKINGFIGDEKVFGNIKNSDCTEKYKTIADKYGDTEKKEFYLWSSASPQTEAIVIPLTIDLICTNRDIDKNHKKNQSLVDITKISILPYHDFIKEGVKQLEPEYKTKLRKTIFLEEFNKQSIVFYDSYEIEISIPPVEESGYYIFEVNIYNDKGEKIKGSIQNPDGGIYLIETQEPLTI